MVREIFWIQLVGWLFADGIVLIFIQLRKWPHEVVSELDREALQLERESARLTQDQVDGNDEVGDDCDNDSEPFCANHLFINCFRMVFIS